jgi:hypothetical protein
VREHECRQRSAQFSFRSGLAPDSPRQPCGQQAGKKRREERAGGGASALRGVGAAVMEALFHELGEGDRSQADRRPRCRMESDSPRPKLAVEEVLPKTLLPQRPHALQQLGGI